MELKEKDEYKLRSIAQSHSDPEVRKAAVNRVKDEYTLRRIAEDDDHPEVRKAAVNRVKDEYTLRRIAEDDDHPEVKAAAFLCLNSSSRKKLSNFDELTDQIERSRYITARRNRFNSPGRDFSSQS